MKFKIHISQLIAKILLNKRSLHQIRQCLAGHIQIRHHFSLVKKYANISIGVFQSHCKSEHKQIK